MWFIARELCSCIIVKLVNESHSAEYINEYSHLPSHGPKYLLSSLALITQLKKETKKKMCMNKKNLVMRTRTIDDLSNRPLNWFHHHKKGGRSCRLKIPLYIVSLTVQHEHMIMANVTRIFYAWFRGTDLSIITKELFLKDRISAQCFLFFFSAPNPPPVNVKVINWVMHRKLHV